MIADNPGQEQEIMGCMMHDAIVGFDEYKTASINEQEFAEMAHVLKAMAGELGVKSARLPEQTRLETLKEADAQELEAPQVAQLVESAYAHRPDLEQNQWGVRQAEADVKARRGEYFPTLSLEGSYTGERTDDFGFESEDMGSTVGINLSYNIFAGGLIR
ncbi:MAG: TolC family protein, partial [Novosphingobium sp.]